MSHCDEQAFWLDAGRLLVLDFDDELGRDVRVADNVVPIVEQQSTGVQFVVYMRCLSLVGEQFGPCRLAE